MAASYTLLIPEHPAGPAAVNGSVNGIMSSGNITTEQLNAAEPHLTAALKALTAEPEPETEPELLNVTAAVTINREDYETWWAEGHDGPAPDPAESPYDVGEYLKEGGDQ